MEGAGYASSPLFRLARNTAASCLGIAVTLVALQVFLRFAFNAPQAWAEEFGRYLFVWSVYLGAIVAVLSNSHIRVTIVPDWLGTTGKLMSAWLGCAVGSVAFALTAYHGFVLAWTNRGAPFYTVPEIPLILFYLAAPIGLGTMALILASRVLRGMPS